MTGLPLAGLSTKLAGGPAFGTVAGVLICRDSASLSGVERGSAGDSDWKRFAQTETRICPIQCTSDAASACTRNRKHVRSSLLTQMKRCTVCWALSDINRTNLYAISRPNMSTASLECRHVHRTRGWPRVCRNNLHISELEYFISESIFCILHMKLHISYWLQSCLPAAVRQGGKNYILHI